LKSRKKILFIVNPVSGLGKKNVFPALINKHFDTAQFETELAFTQYRNHGAEISKNAANQFDAIVAVGGDGSVNEIGGALVGTNTSLGIVPAGSGNGLARHLRIPLRHETALKRIAHFDIKKMDTGKVNDSTFLGTCGFGFDAHIAKKFDEFHHRGFSAYGKLVLKEFRTYLPLHFKIHFSALEISGYFLMCGVANSRQFGNGFVISPKSATDDGTMELVMLEKPGIAQFPVILARFFNGTIDRSKKFSFRPFREQLTITVDSPVPIPFHLDGEPSLGGPIFVVTLSPDSLNVL